MINSLHLHNWESYKDTTFDFSPGVNAIIGPSDKGKSGAMRGLLWAITNRPQGTAHISHWAKDSSKKTVKIKDYCEVVVDKGDNYVSRLRDGEFNGYKVKRGIKESELEALKTDVPDEVKDFFNVGEVNIQKQIGEPFLLGATPGEVARFLNKTINLDIIDKTLSEADSRKRSYKKKSEQYAQQADELTSQIENMDWIDDVVPMVEQAEKLDNRIQEKKLFSRDLELSLVNYEDCSQYVQKNKNLIDLEPMIDKAIKLQSEIEDLENKNTVLTRYVDNYTKYKTKTKVDLKPVEQLLNDIELTGNRINTKKESINNFYNSISKHIELAAEVINNESDIKTYEDQLPDVCPMCEGTGKLK